MRTARSRAIATLILAIGLGGCGAAGPARHVAAVGTTPGGSATTTGGGGGITDLAKVPYVPDVVLVQYKPGVKASEIRDLQDSYATEEIGQVSSLNVHVLKITDGTPVPDMIAQLRKNPLVQLAEPNYLCSIMPRKGSGS